MNTIRTGALFAILGILLGPVLIFLVGFSLPFLSMAMDSVDQADGGLAQLALARKFIAPATFLFVIAAWLMTPREPKETARVLGWRMLVRISSLAVVVAAILSALEIKVPWLGGFTWMALLVFGLLQVARICLQMQRGRMAAATIVLLVLAVGSLLLPMGDPYSVTSLFLLNGLNLVLSVTATVGILIVFRKIRNSPTSR